MPDRFRHAITVTGAVAIAYTTGPLTGKQKLTAILVHVNTAPTTTEALVVTLDSVDGSVYDTVLYSKDMAGITDIAFTDIDLTLVPGDALTGAYTNTDARTVGVRLMLT